MNNWIKILTRGSESKEIDYKGPLEWNEKDKEASCEIVKDIMAMANTNGGWIVFGVAETDSGFDLVGLSPEQTKSFETTRINNFVQRYADPPINTETVKVPHEGKTFIIISVPQFKDTPHVCRKEFPKWLDRATIYVRTDNNESAPIETSSDFRNIVETAIRKRSDQLLVSFRTILEKGVQEPEPDHMKFFEQQLETAMQRADETDPNRGKNFAYRFVSFIPSHFDQYRFNLPQLKSMASNAGVDYRGWPFLFVNFNNTQQTYAISDGYETLLAKKNQEFHFWQLRQSGLLYTEQIMHDVIQDPYNPSEAIMNYDGLVLSAAEVISSLVGLYDGYIDNDEEVVLSYTMFGVQDLRMGSGNPARSMPPDWICRTNTLEYAVRATFLDWKTGLVNHALDLCLFVLERFHMEIRDPREQRRMIEEMLSRRFPRYW